MKKFTVELDARDKSPVIDILAQLKTLIATLSLTSLNKTFNILCLIRPRQIDLFYYYYTYTKYYLLPI